MKFQNCILINFVTDARTDARTDRQAESNMPLQLFHKKKKKKRCQNFFLSVGLGIINLALTSTKINIKSLATIRFQD